MAETALNSTVARRALPVLSRVAVIRIATIVVVLAAYELVARSGLLFQDVVPPIGLVVRALIATVLDPGFYPHVWRTAAEVGIGFAIGALLGATTGLFFGMSRFLAGMFNPWVEYLAPAPKIILLPILFLLFGVGIGSKIGMAAMSAFFPLAITTYAGMRGIPAVHIRVARAFNATRLQMVTKVYIPSLIAPVMTGLRLALGVAIVGTLLAEIKMSNLGLGYLIIQHYNYLRLPEMYAVLFLTFSIAVAANAFMGWLANRVEHDR
ncbi:ABC transporter permease subunit [Hoeflea sp.]|uniref:ABC transporter permease n=1 Tax=Hoeflea sp. TaxID=1940281 RepID=UPI00198EF1F7|nr:ABC transporter permease subunit [Hoeflea sp.]MBC7286306.1 ABC transporter permease subunit [Hoeflea sp.]